ncbi:MAG: DJ-1/PfpI family protein [Candidatus Pacebacteria bacterium]|nr:DJ-1/PfpI family protein [Candidatus Paceibacterota bacterium]
MQKVALIIANREFRDEEYTIVKDILTLKGLKICTFSNKTGLAVGRFGNEVDVKNNLEDLDVKNFDAIVFIGGAGALDYLNNDVSYNLIKSFIDNNKIVGAICISPVILAESGVLKGKSATVWSSPMDKSAVEILKKNMAKYNDLSAVIDGNIVTGRNCEASSEFALAVFSLLTNCQK